MSIIQEYIDTPIHVNLTEMYKVTNPRNLDFVLKLSGGEDYIIPAKMSLTFPYPVAMRMAISLAKQITYDTCDNKNKWQGLNQGVWLPIAETLIAKVATSAPAPEAPVEPEKKVTEDVKTTTTSADVVVETEGDIEKLSYRDLQKLASSKGIPVVGKKKADLLTALKDAN